MPQRPVFLKEFGQFLKSLRDAMELGQATVANIAARRGIPVSYQALRGLEEGTTKSPEPELLKGLADLYKVPYEEIVRRYVAQRYGVDLAPDEFKLALEERFGGANRFVLDDSERALLDAWRKSADAGRTSALAVLQASRKKRARIEAEPARAAKGIRVRQRPLDR